jgi:hypothetical protein
LPMPDRISLRSKLLEAANAQRDRRPWRRLTRKELDDMFDPCRWREPVYAWLLANHAQVERAGSTVMPGTGCIGTRLHGSW